jgi:hopanoid biosynthesis associated RND transporter like protein HpnN
MRGKEGMRQDAPDRQNNSKQQSHTLLTEALRTVTQFVTARPRMTLGAVLLLACVSVGLTVTQIEFKTQRADLIDANADFQRRWIDYTESFGDASDIVVVVEANDSETIKETLEELGSRLTAEPELFSHVLYKFEPGRLRSKGLHYLSPKQLEAGLSRFKEYRPILQGRWDLIRLDTLLTRMDSQLRAQQTATASTAATDKSAGQLLQHADLLTTSMSRFLVDPNDFRSPWPDVVPVDSRLGEEQQRGDEQKRVVYLLNDAGTMGFLKTFPAKDANDLNGASKSIDRLRELIAEVSATHTDVTIGMTGIPILESDEMRRSQSDMTIASIVSFAGVGLLLFLGFRGFRHPLLALGMLVIGIAWSVGYTTLAIGHLNILSVSFAVILIGLGIDFAIHYLARYLELRHEGQKLQPALLETSSGVGAGIITAAITTSLAFFCATFTQFLGVAELGVIVGGGILLCAAATFLVLPALVTLADKNVEPKQLPTPFEARWLREFTARFPALVGIVSVVLIVGVGSQVVRYTDGHFEPRVRYDYNLLNLQAAGLESVELQNRVFENANNSLLFAVSIADTPAEARALRWKFEKLPSVDHVEELASKLPAHPTEETGLLVQAFRVQLARLPKRPPRFASIDPSSIGRDLERLYRSLKQSNKSQAKKSARTLNRFLDRFENLSLKDQTDFLNAFQRRTAAALLGQFRALESVSNTQPVVLDDLPAELTARFVSPQGKWLLQIYPKQQIWDVEPLSQFVEEVRSVDPEVTGTPLQNYEASRQIFASYKSAAIYALAVICVVLLIDFLHRDHKLLTLLPPLVVVTLVAMIVTTRGDAINPVMLVIGFVGMAVAIAALFDFRNLCDAAFAMVPPLAGGLLMLGVLGLTGIDLNPANLIVLPLVLGIGVDDGVHVMHDYRMQRRGQYRTSSSTINAIVLTSLTSMIGFGSMMFAAHRGLYSVGLVLVIGIGSCLFVSLVTLPAMLTLADRMQSRTDDAGNSAENKPTQPQAKAA